LSKTKPLHTIKFILFDDEEGGLNGSDYYVNTLEGQCDFMVNCDMVGTMKTGTPDTAVAAAFRKYPWAQAITYRDARGGSDHDGFTRRGIPNVFIHTGLHSRYHEKTDTASTLNYGGMDKINEFLLYLVRTFDKDAGQIKSFVRALPPYTGI
jgi:Zn-dependent M28 family amino/carboxypeptidase